MCYIICGNCLVICVGPTAKNYYVSKRPLLIFLLLLLILSLFLVFYLSLSSLLPALSLLFSFLPPSLS